MTNKTLNDPEVITYLDELKKDFVIVPIDKMSGNIALICKKFYTEKILIEVGLMEDKSKTYTLTEKTQKK